MRIIREQPPGFVVTNPPYGERIAGGAELFADLARPLRKMRGSTVALLAGTPDIARAMGVDIVIVVDVGFPLLPRAQMTSAPAISNQMLAILIRRNASQQLATLTSRDILIQPALGDTSSFDFGAVAKVIGNTIQGKKIKEGDIVSSTIRPRG